MKSARSLMEQGVADGVFPGGVLLAARRDSILFFEAFGWADLFSLRQMKTETIFDLASLTKPLTTTLAVLHLHQEGKLDVTQPLSELLGNALKDDKSRITVRDLLVHESGLPSYRPYYLKTATMTSSERKAGLRELLAREKLEIPIGGRALYSDIGFMFLEWVVETVSGMPLDRYLKDFVYARMEKPGHGGLFFPGAAPASDRSRFAATEFCTWRNRLLVGEVHDENAHSMNGVAGHSGLFGTALDVWEILSVLIADFHGTGKSRLFRRDVLEAAFNPSPVGGRAMGFDVPSPEGSSCGRFFSKATVGHLGFTGTSFWMDLDRQIAVILLTNRIHPFRGNQKMRPFRPRLHDAVLSEIR